MRGSSRSFGDHARTLSWFHFRAGLGDGRLAQEKGINILESHIPSGPNEKNWDDCGCKMKLVNPANCRGALFANHCFTQIHPTPNPQSSEHQSELTLTSELPRNDKRVWVAKNKSDKCVLNSIPEDERDYYVERRYPSFGNLVLELLLGIALLAGCAELPVSTRAPYSAAPSSYSAPWQPPPTVTINRPQVVAGRRTPVPVDPDAVYGLADLIDFAHRTNPETRRAWEEARAAAAQVARAEAAYYPTLFLMAAGGTSRVADGGPSLGTFTIEGPGINPQLQLNWILLDFGRRGSSVDRRGQELFQANFAFNRKLQEVAFAVSRNYFSLMPAGRE